MPHPTDTSVEDWFKHTPLADLEHEIRLFELQIIAGHDTTKLELQPWRLAEWPPYSAISYVWGNPTKSGVNEIKNQAFGTSAYYTLQQVLIQRKQNALGAKYFWMDSLCINRYDLGEKGKQVYLMGDIYERAEGVLACVGAHADDSELVVEVFRKANIISATDDHDELKKLNTDINEIEKEFEDAVQTNWQNAMLTRQTSRYISFSSLSAVQFSTSSTDRTGLARGSCKRFCSPEDSSFLCGFDLLDMRCLAPCLTREFVFQREWTVAWLHSKMLRIVWWSHHIGTCQRGLRIPATSLLPNLYHRECTDFQDRVSALLRMMQWPHRGDGSSDINIRPDYNITKLGLLRQVAIDVTQLRRDEERLGILSTLYQTLRLSFDYPDISELVNQRKAIGKAPKTTKIKEQSSDSRNPMLECTTRLGARLRSSTAVLTVPASTKFESGPLLLLFRHTTLLEIRSLDGEHVGWTCPQALPGHHLISNNFVTLYPVISTCVPHLVVRREQKHSPFSFKIIGHAAALCDYRSEESQKATLTLISTILSLSSHFETTCRMRVAP